MKKAYFLLLLVSLLGCHGKMSNYQTIYSIENAKPLLSQADKDTLVIFDVDEVILCSKDLLFRPNAANLRNSIFEEYKQKYGTNKVDEIRSSYYILEHRAVLLEKEIVAMIADLQQRGIPTIALTALGTDKLGRLTDPVKTRLNRLKRHGIIFTYNHNTSIRWSKDSGFEGGVIFAGDRSKGETLKLFWDTVAKWKPKRVIFIDDKMHYLQSVASACKDQSIHFTGLHYQAELLAKDPKMSTAVANLQVRSLYDSGKWIPDERTAGGGIDQSSTSH